MANIERRRLKVELETPAIAKPGEPLHIKYKTDRKSKIAVLAVDQGILQVSDYKLPDPLGFFFRKCALGVETAQIVDLIMPEYSILRSLSAFGGDGDNPKQLNTFKRVTEKPVVFWSGIIDADHEYVEHLIDGLPDKYRILNRQAMFGDYFSFYLCDLVLKLNGKGGQPVYVKLAGQSTGRCTPK